MKPRVKIKIGLYGIYGSLINDEKWLAVLKNNQIYIFRFYDFCYKATEQLKTDYYCMMYMCYEFL